MKITIQIYLALVYFKNSFPILYDLLSKLIYKKKNIKLDIGLQKPIFKYNSQTV